MGEAISLRAGLPRPVLRRDERLARRAARGDERAFAAIFERYHQDLYRYCHSILRDPEDAQDALQSTMASALRALPGETREIALRPWLFRVAHNHAVSIARTRGRTASESEAEEIVDPRSAETPETRLRLRQLLADLAALPEAARGALTMRELSGLSYDEIAAALDISPQAARQQVYQARVSLAELEEGREMRCESVRERISDGDRRALRAKRIRAHLRACSGCRDFQAGIDRRAAEFAALCPPLPALAATAVLQGVLGGGAGSLGIAGAGAGAAGSAAGLAAPGAGISLALKGATTLAAATALGVGAAGYSGLVDVPLVGGDSTPAEGEGGSLVPAASPVSAPDRAAVPAAAPGREATRSGGRHANGKSKNASAPREPGSAGKGAKAGAGPPGHAGQPGAPPHASAGGASSSPSVTPPATPGAGPPAHSQAPSGAEVGSSASPAAGTKGVAAGPSASAAPQAEAAVAEAGSKAPAGPRTTAAE